MTEIINNICDVPEGDYIKEQNTDGERMFSQSELEEIISERLSRERKKNESLSSVKALLKSVAEKGLIKGSSYADMAKELAERLKEKDENTGTRNTLQTSEETAKEEDVSLVADKERETVLSDGEKEITSGKEENADTPENFMSVLSDVKNKYGKEEIGKLFAGDLFERFAKGRNGNTREVIDEFLYFVNSVGQGENGSESYHGTLASTAFSADSSGTAADVTLTKQQMEMAKSAGMSYREYAHLLGTVPMKTGRTF